MSRKIRQYPRVRPRQLNAFIDLNGKALGPFVVDNISFGGALLRTPEAVEVEGDARFAVLLAGPACPKGVRAFARLVAAEKAPPALRIEWPQLDPHAKDELVRLLEASGLGRKQWSLAGAEPAARPTATGASAPATPAPAETAPSPLEGQSTVVRPARAAANGAGPRVGEASRPASPSSAPRQAGSVSGPAAARACAPPLQASAPAEGREALVAKVEALEGQLAQANAQIRAQQAEIQKLWAFLRGPRP